MKKLLMAVVAATIAASAVASSVGAWPMTYHCRNNGGNEPQGQCNGQGLDEYVTNPGGNQPPGQQP